MAGTVESQEVAARDDAQLRALGIKPELRRTLGFLSNFAIAFSFISVSTGSFGNFGVGLGLGGPAAIFWSWVLVVTGQFIVCLGFAELASHFPVAGSIYQWSKRLSNWTLGWFTGWFYFWAQVVTVSAVAVIVGYVIAGFTGGEGNPRLTVDPLGIPNMHTFIAVTTLVITTIINAFGVRLLSILNNIGVATEILGMVVFALILLFFANLPAHLDHLRHGGAEAATNGTYLRRSRSGSSCRSSSSTGSIRPAASARRPSMPLARPRAASSLDPVLRAVGLIFLAAVLLSMQNIPGAIAEGLGGRLPDRHDHQREPHRRAIRRHLGRRDLLVGDPRVRVRLHAGDPGSGDADDVLDGSRPAPAVRQRVGPCQPEVQDTGQRRGGRRHPGGDPDPPGRPDPAALRCRSAATGLIYLSYFMCNLGVAIARSRGWPHKPAWFNLGRWGMLINILALYLWRRHDRQRWSVGVARAVR